MIPPLAGLLLTFGGQFIGRGVGPDPTRVVTVVHEKKAQAPIWPWYIALGVLGIAAVQK